MEFRAGDARGAGGSAMTLVECPDCRSETDIRAAARRRWCCTNMERLFRRLGRHNRQRLRPNGKCEGLRDWCEVETIVLVVGFGCAVLLGLDGQRA